MKTFVCKIIARLIGIGKKAQLLDDSESFGYNRLWHETSLELVKKLWGSQWWILLAGNCRPFLYCLAVSKAIIITKALSKKYSTKILPNSLQVLWGTHPNWVDVPNLISSFFFSWNSPQKKSYWDLVELIWRRKKIKIKTKDSKPDLNPLISCKFIHPSDVSPFSSSLWMVNVDGI